MIRSVVRGYGSCLPRRVVTNKELEGVIDTTDEWIIQRTGIRQRYVAVGRRNHLLSGRGRSAGGA